MNLGFLSTSKDESVGLRFAHNILFIIKIKKEKRSEDLDFGFADISEYSYIKEEEEVLFNPLNSFLIEKCGYQIIKGLK